jgi:hypothetical protein
LGHFLISFKQWEQTAINFAVYSIGCVYTIVSLIEISDSFIVVFLLLPCRVCLEIVCLPEKNLLLLRNNSCWMISMIVKSPQEFRNKGHEMKETGWI